jgi:transposase-like protein
MARAKKEKKVQQLTFKQFDALFPNEDACKGYLKMRRWPNGVRCPRCGNENVYELPSRPWHWQCEKCGENGYRFSLYVGTIFENTNMPLKDWFRVIHLMLTAKKGVSALQVHRTIGTGSYRTAWYMCHRVRAGLRDEKFRKLMGIVEVDETMIGGKGINKHGRRARKGWRSKKTIVIGAVRRKGNIVARVLEPVSKEEMQRFVEEAVSHKVSLLATDEHPAYKDLRYPQHKFVKHSRGQYVVGAVHTQTIEGFWSILKRGVVGTFHKVSKKYMPLYVAEFQFRYNNRLNSDIFGTAISTC